MKSFSRSLSYSFYVLLLLSIISCGTKKTISTNSSKAAKTASTMANLKNKSLYNFINDWVGVPYRNGGLDKKGIDCSGFALLLQKQIYGNLLPRKSSDQANAIQLKSVDRLQEGDLIFFSFEGRNIDHVGIYLNKGYFVHASTSRGVIVDDLNTPIYQKVLAKSGSVK